MGDLPRYHELGDVIAGLLPFNLDELPINITARVVLVRCEKYLKNHQRVFKGYIFHTLHNILSFEYGRITHRGVV